MATKIYNQATLTYQYGETDATAASNVASATLQGPLTASKSSLSTIYRPGDDITYHLFLSNNGTAALANVQIVDDLAAYALAGTNTAIPLTYTGPAHLYLNGVFSSALTPTVLDGNITFKLDSLAGGAKAMIMYKAKINDYAPRLSESTVTNHTAITADGMSETVRASYAVEADGYADVKIIKSMTPDPVTDGSTLTYTFVIYNHGNLDATGMLLTDSFSPRPADLSVMVNGQPAAQGTWDYIDGAFTYPKVGSVASLAVPAATYTQNPTTGLYTTSPGTASITVSGTI